MPKSSLTIGDKAPALTLKNQDGKSTSLNDFAGQWVILYFYPKDDTPGCTTEACEFTAGIKDFTKLNATVIGVSPDSPKSHQEFIKKHNLKVTLLSDPTHKVMERYGAWGTKNMYGKITEGVIRSTAIVDHNGKIAHRWKRARAAGHASAVEKKLRELQAKL